MKRITTVLIFAAAVLLLQSCRLFDKQPEQIDVYACGLDAGESLLLWSDSPSVKVLDGGNISSYAVTASTVSSVGNQAYSSAPRMDLQDAVPASDGWTYIRFLLVPHRYNDLSYCVTLVKDGVEHTFTALLMDEPHSHTLTPFCGMMAGVSLPAPMTKTYNE